MEKYNKKATSSFKGSGLSVVLKDLFIKMLLLAHKDIDRHAGKVEVFAYLIL
jgi:hypothetical protein